MANVADSSALLWTAVDLVRQLGAIPLHRVVSDPPPGAATVDDVVRLETEEDRLCELIDGTLVEKTMGAFESFIALQLASLLNDFVNRHSHGIALGADGMLQLFPNQVRIPDACFISMDRLKGSGFPDTPVPEVVPNLVVEVISRGNTQEEMDRKLSEYFAAGVKLVWYLYPQTKTVDVYRARDVRLTLAATDSLDGDDVLPGFCVPVSSLFAFPDEASS